MIENRQNSSIIFLGDKNRDYQKLVQWAYANLDSDSVLELEYWEFSILKDNLVLELIADVCDIFSLDEGEDDAIFEKDIQIKLLPILEEHCKEINRTIDRELVEKVILLKLF